MIHPPCLIQAASENSCRRCLALVPLLCYGVCLCHRRLAISASITEADSAAPVVHHGCKLPCAPLLLPTPMLLSISARPGQLFQSVTRCTPPPHLATCAGSAAGPNTPLFAPPQSPHTGSAAGPRGRLYRRPPRCSRPRRPPARRRPLLPSSAAASVTCRDVLSQELRGQLELLLP